MNIKKYFNSNVISLILSGIALVAIIVAGYFIYSLSQNNITLKNEMSSTTEILSRRITNLELALATTTLTSQELTQRLMDQQNQSNYFQDRITNIAGTVGTLEKLSKTDKELLQKYSKVYFLNDNYVPMSLATIDQRYVWDKTKTLQFHNMALTFLNRMLDLATNSGVQLRIVSAYRSFGEQSSLKNDYLVTYGSGANQFSADQGYSEHQLGTTVDITTDGVKIPLTTNFEETASYKWLIENAYRYGFILSYPKNNLYYEYEPWHWRFVGVELATKLYNEKIYFSDMEQRIIDTFLVKIFD
jgi:D-alanyl-D-alanine carboxypeptidase